MAAFIWPGLWIGVILVAGTVLGLNMPLYRFFYQKRSLRFMLQVLPWHWMYFASSGIAFGIGLLRYGFVPRLRRHHPKKTLLHEPSTA